jgi:hypothetical protein
MEYDQTKWWLVLGVTILALVIGFYCWKEQNCQQKRCPSGLIPYSDVHHTACICVKEAE